MHGEGFLLTIAQALSYIPGGAWSFWKFIGLLLSIVGFAIALWLILGYCDGWLRSLRQRFTKDDMHRYEVRPRKIIAASI